MDVPRDVVAVFTGVSGSGTSSPAFGTVYAEAQRRCFASVAPYARRLIHQVGAPEVGEITGLPPAVSRRQRRAAPTSRSPVGSTVTHLSNSPRMLSSRAGDSRRGPSLQLLDEPTNGPHPAGVDVLMRQVHGLVDAGHTAVVVEHDTAVVAGADHVTVLGPGGGRAGGRIVGEETPARVATATGSARRPVRRRALDGGTRR